MKKSQLLLLALFLCSSVVSYGQSVYSVQSGTYIATMPGDRHDIKTSAYITGFSMGSYHTLKDRWQLRILFGVSGINNIRYPRQMSQNATENFYLTATESMSQTAVHSGVQRLLGEKKNHSIYLEVGAVWQEYYFQYDGYSSKSDTSGLSYRGFTGIGQSRNFTAMSAFGYNYDWVKKEKYDVQVFGEARVFLPFSDRKIYKWKEEVNGLYAPHQEIYDKTVAASAYASVSYSLSVGLRLIINR